MSGASPDPKAQALPSPLIPFDKLDFSSDPQQGGRTIQIAPDDAADNALGSLTARTDRDAVMMKRLLALPDLTRTPSSPVYMTLQKILTCETLRGFDQVHFPEVVSTRNNFDVLLVPADHPARSINDTYYLTPDQVLRTHTTTMWPFYLSRDDVRERLEQDGMVKAVGFGKCYRKDSIDSRHYPCFHQIDGLFLVDKKVQELDASHLEEVFLGIARSLYGSNVETEIQVDTFPFTHTSRELYVKHQGSMLEVVGGGIVRPEVLSQFGIDPERYNGWAFGFGIDRLAMVMMGIPDIRVMWSTDERVTRQFVEGGMFTPVSKFPPVQRDISFLVPKTFNPNQFYELVRMESERHGIGVIEEVSHLGSYVNDERFGPAHASQTFRLIYRSNERTLSNEEVNDMQQGIREAVVEHLGATLR